MKIVFICASFYPSVGGVETHVLEVARELTRRGHQVSVITEDKQSNLPSANMARKVKSADKSSFFTHRRLDQIDIYYFKFGQPSFFKKFYIWYLVVRNLELFQDTDIIHVHDVFIWYLPLRFLYWRKKVYITFHGYETVFPPTDKAKFIRRVSEKLSNGNIIVGDFIKKWYGTVPDYVTYGGVTKRAREKAPIKIRNSIIKLLLIGRLEKDIGIQTYKDTLRKLTDRNIKFTFTVCGEGSLGQGLEQYGEVMGFVKDVVPYIKKADIVFASSYLSMLQALQLGTPVFATYSNPLKHDYLSNSPFEKYITISDSPEDLARKVARFVPNMQKLKDAAKWANSQTWEKVTDIYIDLWNKK